MYSLEQYETFLLRKSDQGRSFRRGIGHRFLDKDMLSGIQGLPGPFVV